MALLTLGLNHTTAPVELREQVAFDAQRLPDALAEVQCSDEGSNPLHPQCSVLRNDYTPLIKQISLFDTALVMTNT